MIEWWILGVGALVILGEVFGDKSSHRSKGVPQDYVEAVKWYRLSAEQGSATAQFNLGVMYEQGKGVPQDYVEAVKWYRLSAEQGQVEAQKNLGLMSYQKAVAQAVHIKQEMLDRATFQLFHMTHVKNLTGILKSGLYSHSTAPVYKDISNSEVNSRRTRKDPIHKRPLHDYVPLYFNPRNAMLYEKQMEYRDDIVIIEVSRRACLSKYTLFTERNAAANGCRFVDCLSDVEKFDWERIGSRNWKSDGVTNIDTKQFMMSECLIHNHVNTMDFTAVHTVNIATASKVQALLDGVRSPCVRGSSELFF